MRESQLDRRRTSYTTVRQTGTPVSLQTGTPVSGQTDTPSAYTIVLLCVDYHFYIKPALQRKKTLILRNGVGIRTDSGEQFPPSY